MLVKVNTSLAGADFSFRFGEEVEREAFAAKVGNGWENLCTPVADQADVEIAVEPAPEETAVTDKVIEAAVKPAPQERRGRRK